MREDSNRNTKRTAASLLAATLWMGGAAGFAMGAGAVGGATGGGAAGGGGGGGHAGGAAGGGAVGGGASGGEGHAGGGATGGAGMHGETGGGTGPSRSVGGTQAPARGITGGVTGGNPAGNGTIIHAPIENGSNTVRQPANAVQGNHVGVQGSRQGTVNHNGGVRQPGDRRGYNPYAPQGNNSRGNYGVVYGYPFYPFSYGWNPGWYGNGYGNYYNNYPSNGYNNYDNGAGTNQATGVYPQATENVQSQETVPTPPTTPTVTGSSSTAVRAVVSNAVDKSPALVAANGTVTQAQSAYNEARERALANLRQQPTYQDALARRRTAASEVHTAKADGGPVPATGTPSQAVVAAATTKLEAGDEVTKMEEQAVASDPAAAAAKARLEQATADRDALKAQLTAQFQQSTTHGG